MASTSSSSIQEAEAEAPASAQWRPKQYVLAGMAIILVASTVTIVTSIILRPAQIDFSIANFSMPKVNTTTAAEDNGLAFNFDLNAYNPSRRARVIYRHVVVSLELQKNSSPSVRKTSVPGNVIDILPLSQGTNNSTSMGVNGSFDSVFFSFYSSESSVSTTIKVIAQVQFKIGLAKSRLYSIRVLCSRIPNLGLSMHPSVANCSA